jgi:hypothetical protein
MIYSFIYLTDVYGMHCHGYDGRQIRLKICFPFKKIIYLCRQIMILTTKWRTTNN